jgi:hypothetical protein
MRGMRLVFFLRLVAGSGDHASTILRTRGGE